MAALRTIYDNRFELAARVEERRTQYPTADPRRDSSVRWVISPAVHTPGATFSGLALTSPPASYHESTGEQNHLAEHGTCRSAI